MATDIVIPEVGESVTEGVIGAWVKSDGDWVERDETVLELETDKITMEIPAPAAGVLTHGAGEGDTVAVGAIVGTIDEKAKKPAKVAAASKKPESGGGEPGRIAPDQPAEPKKPKPATTAEERATPANAKPDEAAHDVRATPLARKVAAEHGVDLSSVHGTGAGDRVREQDVRAFVESHGNGSPAPAAPPKAKNNRGVRAERMSPLRQRLAARLVEAQQTAAMLTTFNECDMSEVIALRARHKEAFKERHGVSLGFMSFFVTAACSALGAYPLVNAFIIEDKEGYPAIEHHDFCHVSVAISSPKGLVVPVLRNAELLGFAGIESGIKNLATRARDGKLTLADLTGGTFTISNGGVFGSLMSTPILNPPQSAILGMHAIKNRPVEDPDHPGTVVVRPMMYLALSYDHRIVDGSEAVGFLKHIKECIEEPQRLMLEV